MESQKNSRNKEKDNVIFVGAKPFVNYIKGVTIQFTSKAQQEVVIKARGKYINKAVDLTEVIKKKFSENPRVKVKEIKIDSEEFLDNQNKKVQVSTIEITIAKR